ncbi:MAG: hypothetical protein ACLT8E_02280 [Akkermansia sp.]
MAAVHGGFHSRRNGSFEYIRMTGGTVISAGQAACELDGDYMATPRSHHAPRHAEGTAPEAEPQKASFNRPPCAP